MADTTIIIPVDSDTARIYSTASADEQQKLQLLLLLRLRELTSQPQRSLSEIMDEIGTQAEARGLTLDLLDSPLHDD